MADASVDFLEVIRRAVDGLAENTLEMRMKVYARARRAVSRQLEAMKPRPPEAMLARQISKLEDAIRNVEASYPKSVIETEVALGWEPFQSELEPPRVPEQQPGMLFGLSKSEGKVAIVPSSAATSDDLQELAGLRSVLTEAVEDLLNLTAGSNMYRQIEIIAGRYLSALHGDDDRMFVDLLYGQGLRLQYEADHFRSTLNAADSGDDLGRQIARAVDSVIAIHGPTIMSTALGRELSAKSRDYVLLPEAEETYKKSALAVLQNLRRSSRIIHDGDAEQVLSLTEDINHGPDPRRVTQLAHSTNTNLMVQLGKLLLYGGSGLILKKAFVDSQPALESAQSLTLLFNQTWAFFILHRQEISEFAGVAGTDLSWINSLLRWMENRQSRLEE
jgi:hypothetical protein